MHQLYTKWKAIVDEFPDTVKVFLKRAILLFVIWKLAYMYLFSEKRVLDGPLTQLVAVQTVQLLNLFSSDNPYHYYNYEGKAVDADGVSQGSFGSMVMFRQWKLVGIGDPCNGLQLLVLYVGFILAMPVALKRKLYFTFGGLLGIHLINVVRCAGLSLWTMHWHGSFDFAHHYLFKAVVYSAIFLLWAWYSKKLELTSSEPAPSTTI